MKLQNQILSDITTYTKYARYKPEEERRETWEEICDRNQNMHIKKYPELSEEIIQTYDDYVRTKKVLPSMRSMQFGGKPIEISPNRIYNCAYMPIDSLACFSETMFLLLGGTGVGYSVQQHHVSNLPEIVQPNKERSRRHLINDSIEGWADAIKVLVESYFGIRTSTPIFDYGDIRPKGSPLKTSGGKAPGPEPLRECLVKVENMLATQKTGSKLRPIQVHDIICHIADSVLAGGIRRSALISLFSANDIEMLTAKSGDWFTNNPHRSRANNSAVILRHRVTKPFFMEIWNRIKIGRAGEPGIYFSNDKDWGTNPCCEIALRPYQFCNLTEINAASVVSQEDLEARAEAAAFLGTLQAGYTDFHYLREVWRRTTEKDALIGVSLTGIASNAVELLDLEKAAFTVTKENERVAELIGINTSARQTCVKPAGTTSLVLGTSSGIHAYHAPYYIRRMRVGKIEPIYSYLKEYHPELVEDEYHKPHEMAVISVPQKAPKNAVSNNESPLHLLDRIKRYSIRWVKMGHKEGQNTHNVSATISLKDEDWDSVCEWMWMNRYYYNGLSIFPVDNHTYPQSPFEEITKEKYNELMDSLKEVDLSFVKEYEDLTDLKGELACAGGQCEI
jgi:ribonucleoside-triphosphate reductase